MNELITVVDGKPVVTSKQVADHFGKIHRDVMRAIRNELETAGDFGVRNFALSSYTSLQNKKLECYEMTRDGFSLIAMGFIGGEAQQWKIKYIEAFNKMEAELRNPFSIPKTLPEALRLAASLEEKRLVLEAKIEHDAPHTNLGKTITASHDCITVAEFVPIMKQAGIKYGYDGKRLWQNNLYDMLRKDGFLLTRPKNMPSADARDEKIFFVEEKTNYDAYGNAHINKQTLITGKGQTKLLDYYRKKDN